MILRSRFKMMGISHFHIRCSDSKANEKLMTVSSYFFELQPRLPLPYIQTSDANFILLGIDLRVSAYICSHTFYKY